MTESRRVLYALLAAEAAGLAGFFAAFYRPDWIVTAFGALAAASLIGILIQAGVMLRG